MEIKLKNEKNSFAIYFEQNGEQAGEIFFRVKGSTVEVFHTEVKKELEGRGIAGKLFDELVQFARKNNYKLQPYCPYIKLKLVRGAEEYSDIYTAEAK